MKQLNQLTMLLSIDICKSSIILLRKSHTRKLSPFFKKSLNFTSVYELRHEKAHIGGLTDDQVTSSFF